MPFDVRTPPDMQAREKNALLCQCKVANSLQVRASPVIPSMHFTRLSFANNKTIESILAIAVVVIHKNL